MGEGEVVLGSSYLYIPGGDKSFASFSHHSKCAPLLYSFQSVTSLMDIWRDKFQPTSHIFFPSTLLGEKKLKREQVTKKE